MNWTGKLIAVALAALAVAFLSLDMGVRAWYADRLRKEKLIAAHICSNVVRENSTPG
jgi:hypothetical protein